MQLLQQNNLNTLILLYSIAYAVKSTGISTSLTTFDTPLHEGQTSVQASNSGSIKEGDTKATFGKGNITVGDNTNISKINRDTTQKQVNTKDEKTGGLNASLTASNSDWLDPVGAVEKGNNEITDAIKNGPKAVKNAYDAIDATIKDMQGEADSFVSNLTGKEPNASSVVSNRESLVLADNIVNTVPNTAVADAYIMQKGIHRQYFDDSGNQWGVWNNDGASLKGHIRWEENQNRSEYSNVIYHMKNEEKAREALEKAKIKYPEGSLYLIPIRDCWRAGDAIYSDYKKNGGQ